MSKENFELSRREFLKLGTHAIAAAVLVSCGVDVGTLNQGGGSENQNDSVAGNDSPDAIKPKSTEVANGTEEISPNASADFMSQKELFDEMPIVEVLFDQAFVASPQIEAFFDDPSKIQNSAQGILVEDGGEKIIYPFFEAVSEEEERGYIAEVQLTAPGKLQFQILNRIVDENGIVGMGAEYDYLTGALLETPRMVFSTQKTQEEIDKLTDGELENLALMFYASGKPVIDGFRTASVRHLKTRTEPEVEVKQEPKSALDPELQAEVLEEFMARPENQGFSSIQEVLEDVKKRPEYKGTISYSGLYKTPSWTFGQDYLIIGERDISVSHLPGMGKDAKVKTLFYMHPDSPDTIVPSVIGVFEEGVWKGITSVYSTIQKSFVDPSSEEFETWAQELVGDVLGINNFLYFKTPGSWSDLPSLTYSPNSEVRHKLFEVEGGYIQKFTEDPESFLGGKEQNLGGYKIGSLENLVQQLDSKIDVGGLITNQIVIRK